MMNVLENIGVARLWNHIIARLNDFVLKEEGKGLSTEDYTTEEKTKLASIEANAEVNVQSDWNNSDPNFATYIKNRPFYAETGTTIYSGTIILNNNNYNEAVQGDLNLVKDNCYEVTVDDISYLLKAKKNNLGIYFGNQDILIGDNQNGTFFIKVDGKTGDCAVSIKNITVKQIDEIFIPMISDEYIIGINTLDYLIEQDSATIIDFYNETVAAINQGRRLLLSQSNGYSEFIYFLAENDTLTLCYKHYGYPNQERIAINTITSTGEVSNITDVCLQADSKTDNMTLAVGRDSYGKLYATMPTLAELGAATIPRITSVTLLAANWIGTANPYSQVIEVPTVTENTKVDLQPTAQQIVTLQNQEMQLMVENNAGVCTCYAIGGKPTSDMNMHVLLTEVVPV